MRIEWKQARRERRQRKALELVTVVGILAGAALWTTALGMVGR